jgi:hypothetical protein
MKGRDALAVPSFAGYLDARVREPCSTSDAARHRALRAERLGSHPARSGGGVGVGGFSARRRSSGGRSVRVAREHLVAGELIAEGQARPDAEICAADSTSTPSRSVFMIEFGLRSLNSRSASSRDLGMPQAEHCPASINATPPVKVVRSSQADRPLQPRRRQCLPVTGRRPNLSRTGRSAQRPTPAGPWCRTQEELEEASAKSAAGQDANARNAPSEVGGACVGRALSTAGAGADYG